MTREEAQAVAARLVTVEDDSFVFDGRRTAGWIVRIGDRTVQSSSYGEATGPECYAIETAWREAIVRALVEG